MLRTVRWLGALRLVGSVAVVSVAALGIAGAASPTPWILLSSIKIWGGPVSAPLAPLQMVALGATPSDATVELSSQDGGSSWLFHALPASGTGSELTQVILLGDGSTSLAVDGAPNGSTTIVRSTDGGQTWQATKALRGTFPYLAADPSRPTSAWACVTDEGLFVSNDDGQTWQKRSPPGLGCHSLGLPPHGDTVVAALGERSLVIWRSADRGLRWQRRPVPPVYFPGTTSEIKLNTFASFLFDPTRPQTVVGVTFDGYIVRSSDDGRTWRRAWTTVDQMTTVHFAGSTRTSTIGRWQPAGRPQWSQWNAGRVVVGPYYDGAATSSAGRSVYYALSSTDHGQTWKMAIRCSLGIRPCDWLRTQTPASVRTSLFAPIAQNDSLLTLARGSTSWKRLRVSITPG